MIATETQPGSVAAITALPWPLTILAGSAAAYAIVQYRYQPERVATVLPVAVRLGAPNNLLAPLVQLHLSLTDAQVLRTVWVEAEQQLSTALSALPTDWQAQTAQWHLLVTPDSPDAPTSWECTVTASDDALTFGITGRPATAGHLSAVYQQLTEAREVTVGEVTFLVPPNSLNWRSSAKARCSCPRVPSNCCTNGLKPRRNGTQRGQPCWGRPAL